MAIVLWLLPQDGFQVTLMNKFVSSVHTLHVAHLMLHGFLASHREWSGFTDAASKRLEIQNVSLSHLYGINL